MQPPPSMVCRLRHSLYGMKLAPRAWFERFSFVVTAAGFSPMLRISLCFFTLLLVGVPFSFSVLMT
jgi:hypothetical protein